MAVRILLGILALTGEDRPSAAPKVLKIAGRQSTSCVGVVRVHTVSASTHRLRLP